MRFGRHGKDRELKRTVERPSASRALLISFTPAYDKLTEALDLLLQTCLAKGADEQFRGNSVTNVRAEELCRQNENLTIIFAGHGVRGALLTAPRYGLESERYKNEHSELLNRNSLLGCRFVSIFAYTCSAGLDFSASIEGSGGYFIGYTDKIWFAPDSGGSAVASLFSGPVEVVMSEFKRRKRVDEETLKALRGWYDLTLQSLRSQWDEFSILHSLAIKRHIVCLRQEEEVP